MKKYIPLIAIGMAAFYMYRASNLIALAPGSGPTVAYDGGAGNNARSTVQPQAKTARATSSSDEPAYKSVVRCLTDLDDILDSITGPASFAAAKPKLLNRMRQQVALVAEHGNQGMQQMGKTAQKEMAKASNRHTESLMRADKVAPGVVKFFEKEMAAVLNSK
jgi:hypothetical protein